MKYIYILCILILSSIIDILAQPAISYITPDIGAPGMAVYVEFIGPHNKKNNFGIDGVYIAKSQDTEIILSDNSDIGKVKLGPLVVSWEGRMISTIIYINDNLNPDKYDALSANPNYQIELQVKVNGQVSNSQTFYIVKSRPFIDLTSAAYSKDSVFGANNLGKRSPRGVLIFDSIKLAPRKYWVSSEDCDPNVAGNQAFLPFNLLVKGKIYGTANASIISVNGGEVLENGKLNNIVQDAPAGGGAGGGSFADIFGMGIRGGNGFTGGGAGGRNKSGNPFSSDKFTDPSDGSGPRLDNNYGGYSLNGVPGPKQAAYEAAAGGTGHPFGRSGEGCGDGGACEPTGREGGGSGWKQNSPGGSGGYATEGSSTTIDSINGGKPYGNIMVVPIAGGSGGAGGNPQCFPSGTSAAGGGGGGAIRLSALSIEGINFEARGANGATNACDNSLGGSGSGGHIGIQSKLKINKLRINVDGGNNSVTFGGSGRVRFDYPSALDLNLSTANASSYRGPTTDTSHIIMSNHILTGTQANGKTSHLYISKDSDDWRLLATLTDENWSYDLTSFLNKRSGIYYVAVATIVNNPVITEYAAEPHEVLSAAATNILKLDLRPFVNGIKNVEARKIYCVGETMVLSAKIWNQANAEANLELQFSDANWLMGNNGFKILGPETNGIYGIKPGDTSEILVEYTMPVGADPSQKATNTLIIPSNDPEYPLGTDWRIVFTIDEAFTPKLTYVGTPNLSFIDTRVGDSNTLSYSMKNTGDANLYLSYIQSIPAPYSLVSTAPVLPTLLKVGDEIQVNLKFSPKTKGDFSSIITLIAAGTDTTCQLEQHTEVKGKAVVTDIDVPLQINLGLIPYCQDSVIFAIPVKNESSATFKITSKSKLIGQDADLFTVVSDQQDELIVQPGEGTIYKIKFNPVKSRKGPISAQFFFTTDDTNFDTIYVDITAEIVGFEAKANPSTINLGNVAVGFEINSSFDINNSAKLNNKIALISSQSNFAQIQALADSTLLAVNGGKTIDFSLYPQKAGLIDDSITVYFNEPCFDSLVVYIKGNAILSKPLVYFDSDIIIKDTNNTDTRETSFGYFSVCESQKFRKLTEYINSSEAPYIVLKEELINDAGGRYKLLSSSLVLPDTISPSGSTKFPGAIIEFNPTGASVGDIVGIYRITIYINGTIKEYDITLRSRIYSGKFTISENPISILGVVGTNTQKNFTITNNGPEALIINNHIAPFNSSVFIITPNPDGLIIPMGQSQVFQISFNPTLITTYLDSITFIGTNSNCDTTFVVLLNGKGEPSKELLVYIPAITSNPSSRNFKLPIYGKFKKATDSMDNMNIFFKLRLNRSLYYPENIEGGIIDNNQIDGRDRVLDLEFNNIKVSPSDTLIGNLIGTTMLGDSKFTDLIISDLDILERNLVSTIEGVNGKLTIEICEEGDSRLLEHNLNPFRTIINPNPAQDVVNITINTLERGKHIAVISDLSGRELFKIDWNPINSGEEKQFLLDVSNFDSGIYFIQVYSPNDVIYSKINIIK
ncbi:MAG TPA: choice-of-anchor D domain-containing protein [Candidatus Kapabacteria bacterium]|nr:choice-of-anchor D domain-containing protein [Candidatus Kapabacteria bacterium]